jgi:GNAT superfamily N-acetyltransferase
MVLREATIFDIPAMHRVRMSVRENVLHSTLKEVDYVQPITAEGRGWVAILDRRVVGFAIGCFTDGQIRALYIEPAYEGRGVGSRLYEKMLEWLSVRGVSTLWLTTAPGTRAERFFLQRGWRESPPHPEGEIRLVRGPGR